MKHAIVESLAGTAWLMPPDELRRMVAVIELSGGPGGIQKITRDVNVPPALMGDGYTPPKADDPMQVWRYGSVAVLPIERPMFHGVTWWGCSYQDIARAALRLASDESVGSVVVMFNSPGGTVAGVTEATEAFKELSKAKPTVAVARDLAASGAAWLASLCRQVVTTPTGRVGSVGAIGGYMDYSEMYEKDGIRPRIYATGSYKSAGYPGLPVTDQQYASVARGLEEAFSLFAADVAAGRRMSVDAVRGLEAEIFSGSLAVKSGLADSVESFESVVLRMEQTYGGSVTGAAGAFPSSPKSSGSDSDEARAGRKEPGMAGENIKLETLTLAQLAAANPGLVETIRTQALADAKEKPADVATLKAKFGDDAFVVGQLTAGATMTQATAAWAEKASGDVKAKDAKIAELNAENGKLAAKVAELEKTVTTLKGAARGTEPVGGGGGGGTGGGEDKAESKDDYNELVRAKTDEIMKVKECGRAAALADAHATIKRTHPEAFKAHLAKLQNA